MLAIQKSTATTQEKQNQIAQLDSNYHTDDDNIFWNGELDICDFLSAYITENGNIIPYADNESTNTPIKATNTQKEQAQNFLNNLHININEADTN